MEYHVVPVADVAAELRTTLASLDAATAGQWLAV